MKTDRWWYRLLQVFYASFVLLLMALYLAIAVAAYPRLDEFGSKYKIVCDNGTQRSGFKYEYLGGELYADHTELSLSENNFVKFACLRADLSDSEVGPEYLKAFPPKKISDLTGSVTVVSSPMETLTKEEYYERYPESKPNYQVVLKDARYTSDWATFLGIVIGGLLLIVVTSLLVRALFLYVLFKEPFFGKNRR